MTINASDFITQEQVLRKAAEAAHLSIRKMGDKNPSSAHSEIVATIPLPELEPKLVENGFTIMRRSQDEIITISDEKSVEKVPGFSNSNYWNFKTDRDHPLVFDLSVDLCLSERWRGVLFKPKAYGNFLSPCNESAHRHIWEIAAANGISLPTLPTGPKPIIFWQDIGLGGIRTASSLLGDFIGRSQSLQTVICHRRVLPLSFHDDDFREQFLPERLHYELQRLWEKELADWRSTLRSTVAT